ncbi:MAG TPA: DUF3325 domain-containing protein [Cellvibrio sp.]|nr:DUF3325 domain-containing protein [Cellvibrio sp.]
MLTAFSLAYCACLLLCSCMNRHSQQLWPNLKINPVLNKSLRVLGWLLVLTTAVYCITTNGVGTGLVILCAVFSLAIVSLAILLDYAARWVPATAIVISLASMVL